jgi:hypothetical protein
MKIGWLTWEDEEDERPRFHETEPWNASCCFKCIKIVYAEVIE